MEKECGYSEDFCQDRPKSGKLKKNIDLALDKLIYKLRNESGLVYTYVLSTIKNHNNCFVQTGSAPNFQGDIITLCTCKHYMRTFRESKDWSGVWIVGFTGMNLMNNERNYLFYLTKISEAYLSHKSIWDALPANAKWVKNSKQNYCGDVYEPKQNISSNMENKISAYYKPIVGHVHRKIRESKEWYADIRYKNPRTNKSPALLVGDQVFSFLCFRPIIYFNDTLPRTKKWDDIQCIIQRLVSK